LEPQTEQTIGYIHKHIGSFEDNSPPNCEKSSLGTSCSDAAPVTEAAVIPLIGEIRPSKFGGAERRISAPLLFTGSNAIWV
jgi:hypothetical protein